MASNHCSWCNDPAHVRPGRSRREFLYVGLIGGLGLTLGDYFGMQGKALAAGETVGNQPPPKDPPSKNAPAKAVIHIFLPGGIAHQECFDPKPLAPIEYR